MNLLQRYIFKQVLVATALAVALFVFVLVLGNVMKEVLDRMASGQIDLPTFLYLLVLLIPGVVPYALPLGLLTAVLLVVGRLCAQREYTAMRAAGLSLWSLAAPVLLVACLGVVLCLFINFDYAPAADTAFHLKLIEVFQKDPMHLFQPGRDVREFPGYILNIGDRNGDNLKDVWGEVLDSKQRVQKFGHGDRGKISVDEKTEELVLTIYDANGYQYNSTDPEDFKDGSHGVLRGDMEFRLPLSKITGNFAIPFKLSLMTLGDLLKQHAGFPPNKTPPDKATATKAQLAQWDKDLTQWRMDVQMQIQRNFAAAFSVLALAMFALPLALRVGRAENFVNLAIALGLALSYYFLLFSFSLLRTHPGARPDLLLWLPNFIFEALGCYLLYRAAQR